ncbi:hypothetical protein LEP1GSC021_3533 [Leptospira noguchii str. 1993005606]|nr:hypothetical protein LEP1GSC021_3533 [Leptospira noguchii str. 1993005606]
MLSVFFKKVISLGRFHFKEAKAVCIKGNFKIPLGLNFGVSSFLKFKLFEIICFFENIF